MTSLASRLATGGSEVANLRKGLVAGVALFTGTAATYLWSTRVSGLPSSMVMDSNEAAAAETVHPEGSLH
jgi:hypothetical protein